MDYLELARKALDLRQFLEADNYLKKISNEDLINSSDFIELRFRLSQHIAYTDYNYNFEKYLNYLFLSKKYDEVIEHCTLHLTTERNDFSYVYHYFVEALFAQGKLAVAAEKAKEHIEFLLSKKLYHQWNVQVTKYEKYFSNFIFFKIMSLQIAVVLEDIALIKEKNNEIAEIVERRFAKLEDIKNLKKSEILVRCYEVTSQLEIKCIESALIVNRALLEIKRNVSLDLSSGEWKKLVELMVADRSWINLKLCLDLSLNRDDEIFSETLKLIKKKKGYNPIKITKFSKELKRKIIQKKNIPQKLDHVSLDAVELEIDASFKSEKILDRKLDILGDDENNLIEKNIIKGLSFEEFENESISDLIITFIQLGLFKVVDFLIKKAEQEILEDSLVRKIKYLKIVTCMEKGEAYLALSELSQLLNSNKIGLSEYIELKYIEGCLFEEVKDTSKALSSYREVEINNPDYRRLQERIKRLA